MKDEGNAGRIFLSYGHDQHAALAQKLYQDLADLDYDVFFDRAAIDPGMNWVRRIEDGINWASQGAAHGYVILLMTPYSTRRGSYCDNEIELAKQRGLAIVPVMVVMVELPFAINTIQYLDMTDCVPVADCAACYGLKFPLLLKALKGGRLDFEGRQSRLQQVLDPLGPPEVGRLLARFTGRRWLIEKIWAWVGAEGGSRVFWISGGPGSGKSALAAWLARNKREIGSFHACRHSERQTCDPRRVMCTIAWQLTTQLADYLDLLSSVPKLEQICEEASAATLFDKLIVQPIHQLPMPDRRILILIDGLDEATERRSNELALFLAEQIPRLPQWARLLITSRPEIEVEQPLQALDPLKLAADSPENTADVVEFIEKFVGPYAPGGRLSSDQVRQILTVSERNWLYLEFLLDELENKRLALDDIGRFPRGLGDIYTRLFARKFPDPAQYAQHGRQLLDVVAAASEPLAAEYAGEVLGWSSYDTDEVVDSFGALLARGGGAIQVFHKSLLDWLSDRARSGYYRVNTTEGHRKLAERGWKEYDGGAESLCDYMAKYLPVHLDEIQSAERLFACITDAAFILRAAASGSHYSLTRFWRDFDIARIRQACDGSLARELASGHDQQRARRMSICLGQVHLNMGWSFRHIEQYDNAVEEAAKAAELFASVDHKAGVAAALSLKGMCRWHQQNVVAALESAGEAVKLFEDAGDDRGRAEALNHIGIIYRSIGQYEKALECLREAESIYRGLKDEKGRDIGQYSLGKCLNSLGTASWWSGQRDEALRYYTEANVLNEKTNQLYILGLTATNLGYVHLEQGDCAGSLEWFERGRRIRREIGTRAYEMMDISGMARAHHQAGERDKAKELSRLAIRTLDQFETVEDLSWAYYNHYVIFSGGGEQERQEALSALAKARMIVERWLATIADADTRRTAAERVPLVREILETGPGGQPYAATAG